MHVVEHKIAIVQKLLASDRLSPDIIRKRLDYWTLILGPKFSAKERKQSCPLARGASHLGGMELFATPPEHASAPNRGKTVRNL